MENSNFNRIIRMVTKPFTSINSNKNKNGFFVDSFDISEATLTTKPILIAIIRRECDV